MLLCTNWQKGLQASMQLDTILQGNKQGKSECRRKQAKFMCSARAREQTACPSQQHKCTALTSPAQSDQLKATLQIEELLACNTLAEPLQP